MSVLFREFAMSRTGSVLFFILLVLAIIEHKWIIAIAFAIIVFIYYMSCRKYSAKIVELMKDKESAERDIEENEAGSHTKN